MTPATIERVIRVLQQFAERDGRSQWGDYGASMTSHGRVRFSYRGRLASRRYLRLKLAEST